MAAIPTVIRHRRTAWAGLTFLALLVITPISFAGPLDELAVDRWAKLREAERFQLNVAEKLYREKQWKVAADEYEKFLKLYESSEGAAFAQLKWSHCMVALRKHNTAIKDGYQTLLDYFPDAPEAPIAALLLARTQKDIGDLKAAKKSFRKAIETYPKHFVAVSARLDLVELAQKEKDTATYAELLRELTFDIERKGVAARECVEAARLYTQYCFHQGNFADGLKALQTSATEEQLPSHLMNGNVGRLPTIVNEMTGSMDMVVKQRGERLADAAVAWLKVQAAKIVKEPKTKDLGIAYWYAAADVQGYAHRPDKQREIYEEMLTALGPNDVLLGRLAQWFKNAKQYDQARATYAKFVDKIEGQNQIAWSFVEEQKYDPAVAAYRTLALQDTMNAAKWQSQVAMTYRRAGKADLAIGVYRELLVSDVKNANTWQWEIAETLYQANRWKEAITAYRGTENFPTNFQRMAYAHRRLKQFNEAIGLYGQIVASSPPSASWALLEMGYTHEEAGKTESAIKVFKQVCDRFPETSQGSAAHSHLNNKYKITVTLGGTKK